MNRQTIARFAHSTTARLALSYLAIIMVLSIGFSFVLYKVSVHELGRQVPSPAIFSDYGDFSPGPGYNRFFENRIDEGRHVLVGRLVLLNGLVLVGGALFSYYLALRTLEPIERAMEAQSRFVTDASHELRTPLTAILAIDEVALRKRNLTLPAAKEVITSNMEEIAKLQALSEGLLNLAKLDDGALDFQPVSLQDVAGEAMNWVIVAAQAKQISIEDSVPNLQVMGDLPSLVQAVVVLLDNAIKYSPEASIIQLQGGSKDKMGYLRVNDSGSGIDADDLPHIFDRFYRADTSRTQSASNGHGIGLSIAKQVLYRHHGHISAYSTVGKGSTFEISVPLA